jgi:hypothetical protein
MMIVDCRIRCYAPFMKSLRWAFSIRALLVLVVAAVGFIDLVPFHAEPWPGHDKEFQDGALFVKNLNERFGNAFEWNIPARAVLRVMSSGVASEQKQNEIRDWAIAEKARQGLTSKVQMEFYEDTNEPRPKQLLKTIEL